jgi:anti-sigma regulatory factor (Ser/Thr protein kinase)
VRHAVTFYDSDADLVAEIAALVRSGLAADEAVVLVTTGEHKRAVEAVLLAAGVDAAADDRYRAFDAADTLAALHVDGMIDAARFDEVIGSVIDDASEGGRPVRAFGEMVALLWADGLANEAIRLEELWNALAASRQFGLLCAYPIASFFDGVDLGAAARVCCEHSDLNGPHSYAAATSERSTEPVVASSFLPVPTAVGAARRLVADVLHPWCDDQLTADASLIVSELATNAVVHAGSPFRVSVRRSEWSVLIGVEDASVARPEERALTPDMPDGRGMFLIGALSTRSGTTTVDGGKVVWSELARR